MLHMQSSNKLYVSLLFNTSDMFNVFCLFFVRFTTSSFVCNRYCYGIFFAFCLDFKSIHLYFD